jgi:tRNA-Thr(GGU) m(6)t(6)A37 methyltransferase TsaA
MLLSERRRREERQRAFLKALPTPDSIAVRPIGVVRSPYELRHDCPRQPTMAPAPGAAQTNDEPALATIELFEGQGLEASVRDLCGFEYIWLIYHFHANEHWRPEIRLPPDPEAPPSSAPNVVRPRRRVGVLSTRSPHRPNPLGLSACRLVRADPAALSLTVAGIDCLDGTPVLDLKPYVPWADAFPNAGAGWHERSTP